MANQKELRGRPDLMRHLFRLQAAGPKARHRAVRGRYGKAHIPTLYRGHGLPGNRQKADRARKADEIRERQMGHGLHQGHPEEQHLHGRAAAPEDIQEGLHREAIVGERRLPSQVPCRRKP